MKEELMQVQAIVDKVSTMGHRSVRVQVDTSENLSDITLGRLIALTGKKGWFTFLAEEREITPEEVANTPALVEEDGGKTPGQRLRNTIFVLWEQRGKPTSTFEEYYRSKMETIINKVKDQLV